MFAVFRFPIEAFSPARGIALDPFAFRNLRTCAAHRRPRLS